jgi:hypothetical protein
MPGRSRLSLALSVLLFAAACRDATVAPTSPPSQTISASMRRDQGFEVLSRAVIHSTVEAAAAAHAAGRHTVKSAELVYGGGTGGIGVEPAPKIYLVVWGSQWNSNDPSGEVAILNNFYGGVGGSSWLNTVTQYCEGVAKGTVFCNGAGTAAGNQAGMLAGIWYDNASAAPSKPSQSNIASEAVRAAQHFGNTTAASNAGVQYVVATSTRNSSSGFGTQYCAYHSSTSATGLGNVAYTNLPYITDAGASCGANFNALGPLAGITIVSGHEAAESVTDPFPNTGWLDSVGSEIGDKCAWIATGAAGASQNVTISTGTFPVQSLWSNAASSDKGGCVISF